MLHSVHVNATQSANHSFPYSARHAPTHLAAQVSIASQGRRQLVLADTHPQAAGSSIPVAEDGVVFPEYSGGYEAPWDVIKNQRAFNEACACVVEYLKTQSLSQEELLYALQTGFFQRPMGKSLADLFVDATMRSIEPKGELTTERLREIVETICKLAPKEWASVFGERLNFPRGTDRDSVAGFIQSQLTLSRLQRDEKIANGELLTDSQWQSLQEIVKQCRSSIRPWQEGRLNSTLMKLEDCAEVRRSPEETKFLLGEFLQRLNEPRQERFPDRHKRAVHELWQSIELKPAPSSLDEIKQWTDPASMRAGGQRISSRTNSVLNAAEVRNAPAQTETDFSLMDRLEEIERKSDFYNHVSVNRSGVPGGLVARILYVANILNIVGVLRIAEKIRPHLPVPGQLHAPRVSPEQGKTASTPVNLSEQIRAFGNQLDQLLSQAMHVMTGWHPVEGVETDERDAIANLLERFTDVLNPLLGRQSPSLPHPHGPYAPISEPLEQQQRFFATWYSDLGAWLQNAASCLAAMGVATFNAMTGATQQHPRAAAAIAITSMTALYAAVNEFYGLRGGAVTGGSHFVLEEDTGLRDEILNEVQTLLSAVPSVELAIKARIANATTNEAELVEEVAHLLEQPVPWSWSITAGELIVKGIEQIEAERFNNPDMSSQKGAQRSKRAAEWTLETLSDPGVLSGADIQLQNDLLKMLDSDRDTPVAIAAGALIHSSLALYKQAVNDKALQAFFTANDMTLSTVRIFHDSVVGTVAQNGTTKRRSFDLWDDSGWWPAAKSLLPVLELLDPDNLGMNHVSTGSNSISRDVALRFYGVTPPTTQEGAKQLANQLRVSGWPKFSNGKKAHLEMAVEQVRQAAEETTARAHLVTALELAVTDKAENATVLLSEIMTDFVSPSLAQASQKIRHHLNDFLALPAMIGLCQARKIDCSANPARVSQGNIQVFFNDEWVDLTAAVSAQPVLKAALDKLLEQAKKSGDTLYTSTTSDLLQIIRFMGFEAPQNAGELRNIVRWLTTSIPPSPPLCNYGGDLLVGNPESVMLSNAERTQVIELCNVLKDGSSSILQALDDDRLLDASLADRRTHAHRLLTEILDTKTSSSWGQQLLEKLSWYGATAGQTPSIEHYRQLLCAAIKLGVDPDAPGEFGKIAGYDIYQPNNRGRDPGAIRADIENHLISNKGVSAQTAPLVAHVFLAQVAPEFLVPDSSEKVRMGSVNWTVLRLGIAIAEKMNPGCSREMTVEQLMALGTLDPATDEIRLLLKTLGTDVMVAWGVMNGVVQQSPTYTAGDYENAARMFARQRVEIAQALHTFSRPLQSRRELAIIELRKVFPDSSVSEIEAMKLWSRNLGAVENIRATTEGTTHDLVEVYMAGDLNPTDWWHPERQGMTHELWARRIRALPKIDTLLTASVDRYFTDFSKAFIAPTKLLFAELPWADRQCLEQGTVELFTLRNESGRTKEDETPQLRAALRGGYGTLIRCEYLGGISYFEVFPAQMKIIKRLDLPDVLPLNGVMKVEKVRMGKGLVNADVQRGTELPFDFQAYTTGRAPVADVKSPKLIIEKLGDSIPATSLTDDADESVYLPQGYFSPKLGRIINVVVHDNFLQGQKQALLDRAKGSTPRDRQKQFWESLKAFALQLIPFVGCVNDLSDGTRLGLINGAFGCFTDATSSLFGLVGRAGNAMSAVRSISPVPVKAFELMKISVGTVNSVINPFSGLPDLVEGSARAVRSGGKMLISRVFAVTPSGIGRLQTGVDKVRSFFGSAAIEAAGRKLPNWANSNQALMEGVHRGANTTAIFKDNKWYGVDHRGKPYGAELEGFAPLIP
ncbi:hypothetical protein HNO86_16790 [Pseudomonas sp. C1C7]|uniref:hypothetical protein n=1 Tax=Pseudomonas sp. C1C7 TaxID=2735272 RepID=UPI0015864F44|nr:hypothetical protein [Pseudomonas sp. C1C7]NUT76703.1 hypothetical protein [Pseudomonas sp. C1C7]